MSLEQYSSLLQAAMSYGARGWRIFPLKPLTKVPLLTGSWPEYATHEPYQILEWWTRFPEANIAIGAFKQHTILDIDRKPGKADGWLACGAWVDQSTPWVATPNRGFHFYYRWVEMHLTALPGIDIQRGNHYVVAPPSRLPEGAYVWGREPGPIFEDGIKPLPDQLLGLLRRQEMVHRETQDPDQPLLLEHPPELPFQQLKPAHQTFLTTGQLEGFPSRSELIHSLATRLYQLGHTDEQVLTLLWRAPFIQDAALEHRQGQEDRALSYLWDSCKKVRHHRRKSAQEVFSATNVPREAANELKNKAMRLPPGGDVRELLQEVAVAKLDAFDEDQVLGILKATGFTKNVLTQTLKSYKATLRDKAKVLNWRHTSGEDERPLGTVENLEILLGHKQVSVRYNLMEHKIEIRNLHEKFSTEERLNSQLTTIRSWAAQYRMPFETVKEQLTVLAAKNEYHPLADLLLQVTWDGRTRVRDVLNTLIVDPSRERSRDLLVYRWLLSIMAAVYGYGNRAPRGVLTFVGPQHVGKTTWLKYLVPAGMYHQGHMLRADNRDSVVKGLRYLLVELGELGTTFKRQDIESLKNHIGAFEDVHRMPYAHQESIWQRRTIFAASANNTDLLKDQTGNTRWWVILLKAINLNSMEQRWGNGRGYDLLQFWAEMKLLYDSGQQWDLTDQELAMLEDDNEEFRDVPPVEGRLLDIYKWEEKIPRRGYPVPKTFTEVAHDMGIRHVIGPQEQYQLREALRRLTGMRHPIYKRLALATMDGKEVDIEARKKAMEERAETHRKSLKGRYWYVPPLKGFDTQEPFKR